MLCSWFSPFESDTKKKERKDRNPRTRCVRVMCLCVTLPEMWYPCRVLLQNVSQKDRGDQSVFFSFSIKQPVLVSRWDFSFFTVCGCGYVTIVRFVIDCYADDGFWGRSFRFFFWGVGEIRMDAKLNGTRWPRSTVRISVPSQLVLWVSRPFNHSIVIFNRPFSSFFLHRSNNGLDWCSVGDHFWCRFFRRVSIIIGCG